MFIHENYNYHLKKYFISLYAIMRKYFRNVKNTDINSNCITLYKYIGVLYGII